MSKHIAFMRAINVGGHASVRMTDLQRAFVTAGCTGVTTYIQSGNVIFDVQGRDTAAVFDKIRIRLGRLLGGVPEVLFRTVGQIERIVEGAPFKPFEAEPGIKLYVTFLSRRPRSKPRFPLQLPKERLEAVSMKNLEVFIVSRRKKSGFYGFPNNFIEKELGVPATSRNWSTVTRIAEFVNG